MRINIHYKAVTEHVWQILQKNYGGGPAIVREAVDIYAKEPKVKSPLLNQAGKK